MHEAAPDVVLRITGAMQALPPALDAVVERHWEEARGARPLFNGRVFTADRLDPAVIEGHWTEYRRTVAQMADESLRAALRVRSLAVCGVLCCREGVAVARRDRGAVYQAAEWQLPPAGSVDTNAAEPGGASWRRALLAELEEELGIGPAAVTALRPLCLVQHPSGVLDLGIAITTDLTASAVLEAHRRAGNGEYEDLLIVPPGEVEAAVAARGGTLVPPAREFLKRL